MLSDFVFGCPRHKGLGSEYAGVLRFKEGMGRGRGGSEDNLNDD